MIPCRIMDKTKYKKLAYIFVVQTEFRHPIKLSYVNKANNLNRKLLALEAYYPLKHKHLS